MLREQLTFNSDLLYVHKELAPVRVKWLTLLRTYLTIPGQLAVSL